MTRKLLFLFQTLLIVLTSLCCSSTHDCTKYRNGKFYMYSSITKDKILIERNDSIQIERNTESGAISKSKIRWINPCEYQIIGMTINNMVKDGVDSFLSVTPINVRIINTEKDYYVFKIELDSANKHVEYSDTIRIEN